MNPALLMDVYFQQKFVRGKLVENTSKSKVTDLDLKQMMSYLYKSHYIFIDYFYNDVVLIVKYY